ncbi:LysR family transcriptional regulator [Pandoraea bronchicola]|uniref:Transcriptional regulator n=1 Tax=Pandoraea bronchicola TaxID=2508287 RepID=A0A5E5BK39_9BURK|nr:LysR substrate-binding domain-containing protein [Pandoraea bronchicola]VVE86229.1 transcriptional regulator [Pandoraea bronchicola]
MFIRQLSYLVALSQAQHFRRAAAMCNVSQPTLSGAIRSIEEEFGLPIVRRGRRFEGFTPEGERVLAWARQVLADCEGLRQEASASRREVSGCLRLGAIPTALPLVPQLTDACLRDFPGMRHEIYTLCATQALRQLAELDLDVGLSYLDDPRLREFETIPLFRERYVLIARDETALAGRTSLSWHEAAKLPLCLLTGNMQCRQGIDAALARAGTSASPRVETDSLMALYAHVRCAGLFSIVPHSVLCLEEMRDELHAVPLRPALHREIGLILRDRQPRAPLLDAAVASFRSVDLQRRLDALLPV